MQGADAVRLSVRTVAQSARVLIRVTPFVSGFRAFVCKTVVRLILPACSVVVQVEGDHAQHDECPKTPSLRLPSTEGRLPEVKCSVSGEVGLENTRESR